MAEERPVSQPTEKNPKTESFFGRAGQVVNSVADAIARDGYIPAALRQGAGELGQALRAFPESVQHEEIGTLFSPTQAEIGNARKGDVHGNGGKSSSVTKQPTPADIARDDGVHGKREESPRQPTPSEIARGKAPEASHDGVERSAEHQHGQGRGR